MARYTGPVCKLCRREGEKLFLKGKRCFTEKCAIERRNYPPGEHGTGRRRRPSEYQQQLREKQKVKRIYGLVENQFKNLFEDAANVSGVTGENLIIALETRIDNVVYRLGLAPSRKSARQLVNHGHVRVNGRTMDIPSYEVSPGEEVSLHDDAREMPIVKESVADAENKETLNWLGADYENFSGRVLERPSRADIPLAVDEHLIVELYSK